MSDFKNEYLAKSYPKETIQEHTNNLLKELNRIKNIYPDLFKNQGRYYLLKEACILHDLGKMGTKFQKMISGQRIDNQIPHGILSLSFLNKQKYIKDLENKYSLISFNEKEKKRYLQSKIKILAHTVAYHHDRELNYSDEELDLAIEDLKQEYKNFYYEELEDINVKKISTRFYDKNKRIYPPEELITEDDKLQLEEFYEYIFIKGLLNRIDYAASAYIPVERENKFLEEKMKNLLKNWQKKKSSSCWNELQEYTMKNSNKNIIAIAQTGMGKTEAGLLWLGNNKGFFVLPLKTAINAIYERIENIVMENDEKKSDKIGLLHSDTIQKYFEFKEEEEFDNNIDLDKYYSATKQLSLPITVCTLDQIFDFVFRAKGFEPKVATLSYSKLIIDEIQMYSPELLSYLIRGLADITKFGGKFIILTATFPMIIKDLLLEEGIDFEISKNFIKKDLSVRHSVKVIEDKIDVELIIEKYNKNKILVICNTVKEAQRVIKELRDRVGVSNEINIFHSKFIKKDRDKKEKMILKMGDKNNKEFGIWVTTQVVEASLDIDFDILFTELSDLNGLFQRMGRCYRNRVWNKINGEYNCYVFIGTKEEYNTGINKNNNDIIDFEIYQKSRKLVKKEIEGIIKEEEKMGYVEKLYTTKNLKNTNYYEKVQKTLYYLKLHGWYEKDKKQVRKEFRNIESVTIIPFNVYEKNKKLILECIEILKSRNNKESSFEDRQKLKEKKIKARKEIYNLTLNIQIYERAQLKIKEKLELSSKEKIEIVECDYSEDLGFLIPPKNKIKNEEKSNEEIDNFF